MSPSRDVQTMVSGLNLVKLEHDHQKLTTNNNNPLGNSETTL